MKKSTSYAALRRALFVLTRDTLEAYPPRQHTAALKQEVARFRARHRAWMQAPGVQGFGVSERVKDGRRWRALRLVVYVEQKPKGKKARARLAHPVPRTLTVPRLGRFVTDVVAIGRLQFHALDDVLRPPPPGAEIGVIDEIGTLGTWVRSNGADPTALLLTCAHVLTRGFTDDPVRPVTQPGMGSQTGSGPFEIAGTAGGIRAEPAVIDPAQTYKVDAGVAPVAPGIVPELTIAGLGVRPVRIGTVKKERVRLVGARTGLMSAVVTDLDGVAVLDALDAGGGNCKARFVDLGKADYNPQKGDSGALVINDADEAVGLHMVGAGATGFFCKFNAVAEKLEIQLL